MATSLRKSCWSSSLADYTMFGYDSASMQCRTWGLRLSVIFLYAVPCYFTLAIAALGSTG